VPPVGGAALVRVRRASIAPVARYWPFAGFAVVVALHHVLLLAGLAGIVTKGLLMGSLLAAVLLVGLVVDRGLLGSSRARYAFVLLCGALALSLAGDLVISVSLELGLVWFVLAMLVYLGLFLGPARARSLAWWAIPYGLCYSPIIVVLWSHLGDFGSLVAFYGLLLMAMAVTSTTVGRTAAVGGLLFMIAEGLLGFRIFLPDALAWFPDPWQDASISLLYCLGQGLLALGVLRRLEREPRLARERAARRAAREVEFRGA